MFDRLKFIFYITTIAFSSRRCHFFNIWQFNYWLILGGYWKRGQWTPAFIQVPACIWGRTSTQGFMVSLPQNYQHNDSYTNFSTLCHLFATYQQTWKWEIRKSSNDNHSIIYAAKMKNLHNKQSHNPIHKQEAQLSQTNSANCIPHEIS